MTEGLGRRPAHGLLQLAPIHTQRERERERERKKERERESSSNVYCMHGRDVKGVVVSLVHTSLGSSYLIAHVLHYPPPPTRTALY
jgi:hypothetical protein